MTTGIVVWGISIFIISIVIGEVGYRIYKKKHETKNNRFVYVLASHNELMEKDLTNMKLESLGMVSRARIQKRGSWRLAQDLTWTEMDFSRAKKTEYEKKL